MLSILQEKHTAFAFCGLFCHDGSCESMLIFSMWHISPTAYSVRTDLVSADSSQLASRSPDSVCYTNHSKSTPNNAITHYSVIGYLVGRGGLKEVVLIGRKSIQIETLPWQTASLFRLPASALRINPVVEG